jgi:hypothetical protein
MSIWLYLNMVSKVALLHNIGHNYTKKGPKARTSEHISPSKRSSARGWWNLQKVDGLCKVLMITANVVHDLDQRLSNKEERLHEGQVQLTIQLLQH